jgi:hypothetical protein
MDRVTIADMTLLFILPPRKARFIAQISLKEKTILTGDFRPGNLTRSARVVESGSR